MSIYTNNFTEFLQILNILNNIVQKKDYEGEIEKLYKFNKETLEKVNQFVLETADDTYYSILEDKISQFKSSLETAYEDGEVIFLKSKWQSQNFWGFKVLQKEAGDEELEYFENIEKLKIL